MDALRPGHAHRSSSDRLLNNYLDAQKGLSASLLTLLSHSHSSTSSLLAYVTSSPGVVPSIRRSVRHAAFEGPLSSALTEDHHDALDAHQGGWAAYISSLERFRKDLKQIHLLEEELSRVKRDREILVTRLIKSTKSRPNKKDLSALANSYSSSQLDGPAGSSRASTMSLTSNGSVTSKESKRAGKLADAQAELLGCEEHLRSLEVRIEGERNKVMVRGLEERFRAMEVVGRMWVSQAKRGLSDLEKAHELPADAFELDSNGSLAPSQSASQMAYEDRMARHFSGRHGPGSITGSIAEEDEGSSGDDAPKRNLVVHENRPVSRISQAGTARNGNTPNKPSPLGVPSVNTVVRPLSSTGLNGLQRNANADSSDDEQPFNSRQGGRRAASDIGALPYHPPTGRKPLRRTFSEDQAAPRRANSDNSSIHSVQKKKGFFASLGRLFKGSSKKRDGSGRSGRDSPAYGSGGGWHTRTESNIKRASTLGRSNRRGDDSSSDDEGGNFVSVSNNRNNTWSVDNVGRTNNIKRSSTMPVASGLIPPKPNRSDLGANKRNSSQSTVTAKNRPTSPTPRVTSPTPGANRPLSRSGTVKSSMSTKSAGTTKTTGTVKSTGTIKKTRANGSISRASMSNQQAAEGRNIMSLVDMKIPPVMPEVPKAPKSQVTPQMELAKAPGSSLVSPPPSKPSQLPQSNGHSPITLGRSISSASPKKNNEETMARPNTPLPPSRTLSPPLKSALRPASPLPPPAAALPLEPPKPMFSITAPGPVQLPVEELKHIPPPTNKRNSYHSMTSDAASIYESAVEDEGGDESSSEEEDGLEGYNVVENDNVARAGEHASGVAHVRHGNDNESVASDDTIPAATAAAPPAPVSEVGSAVARRKSVRMAIPDSPLTETFAPKALTGPEPGPIVNGTEVDRAPSPEPERVQQQWSSRIGNMREDTSDEEDLDPSYTKARKGLQRSSGKWDAAKKEADEKLKRRTSTKSNKSSKSSRGGRI